MEAIRIFLAFARYMNFKVYQMDVKSTFLNGKLKEEVYVKQPLGFESSEFPDYVCKLDKDLYGLKQAPRAWYLKGTPTLGMYYLKCSGFDLKGYSDSDYAGCNMGNSMSPPPLVAKPKNGKSQTVASTLPKSQGLEALGALSKKRTKPKSKRPPTETKESPPKPTEGSEQSHSVSSGTGQRLRGNKPPADMEPLHTTDADLSGTGAKYQEDQTQSSKLRYQSLTKNKGEPSYEGEPDTQPMLLTYVDVRAILLSEDEAQESNKEVLAAGDDMDEDPQDDKEVRTPSPKQDQPAPSHVQESTSNLSSPDLKRFNNILPLTKRQYTSEIKSIMTEMYAALQGRSSSVPSGSVTPTLALTDIPANVEGENATTTATEEPPSHTKSETEEPRLAIPISSIPSTVIPTTQPITSIIIHFESSQATLKINKGKGIATESNDDPLKKLVKASSIVPTNPNKLVRVEFIINRRIVYLTEQEIQKYCDKKEQIKKAKEEAKLNVRSKTEVIKVVREEAKKLGIYPKEAISTKAGELFKKARDAEHESDIDKVDMEALVSYLVAASMVKSPENESFSIKLRKLIAKHPDQEKFKSKKVKLDALGYNMD
nr:retrovirus-related Pol polyprotein from transposon TNT 1-94 [Tanacetum cinerariifolium]